MTSKSFLVNLLDSHANVKRCCERLNAFMMDREVEGGEQDVCMSICSILRLMQQNPEIAPYVIERL